MHSGPFGYRTNLDAQRGKVVQKLVPRSRIGIFHNKRTRSTPLDPKQTFSGPFGCLTKLGEQGAEVVQKFMPRSRVEIFRNERTRSIPVDTKLMFWSVLLYLGALRTVLLRYETQCKTGQTSAKVHATKSRRNFSQRMHPIHPIGP